MRGRYRELQNDYRKLLRSTKNIYYSNLINNSVCKSKSIWAIVSSLTNVNTKSNVNDTEINAQVINSFFIDKVEEIVNGINQETDPMDYLGNLNRPSCKFEFLNVQVHDVYSAILELRNSSCLDVHGINSKILKLAAEFVCEPLVHIFNNCIDLHIFPENFKYVKVIPIFKKGDKNDYVNYRPISIISTVSKVFENLLYKQIYTYF